MEGRLEKWTGLFSGWKEFKYILHEGILYEYNLQTNEEQASISMEISKIILPKQPLQFLIHNGVSQISLRAKNIKEKVDWVNTLNECKTEKIALRESQHFKEYTDKTEEVNEASITNIFNNFDPLFQKIGKVWSTQAQLEEVVSLMEPEINKNPKLQKYKSELLDLSTMLKQGVAEVLTDLEVARNEFAKALQRFAEGDDQVGSEDDQEEVKSQATLRSIRIDPDQNAKEQIIEEVVQNIDDEEEKVSHVTTTLVKFNPKQLGEDHECRTELPYFRDPNKKISIWTIIRESIGQDLTKVTLPIILNEPVTMLQKTAEAMEHYKVLENAATEENPYVRAAYVTIFTTVQY